MLNLYDLLYAAQNQKEWIPLKGNRKVHKRYIDTSEKSEKTREQIEKFIYTFMRENKVQEHKIKEIYNTLADGGHLTYFAKTSNIIYPYVKFRSICREFHGTDRNLLSLTEIFSVFLRKGEHEDIDEIYSRLIKNDKVKNYLPYTKIRKRYYDWLATEEGMRAKTKIERAKSAI